MRARLDADGIPATVALANHATADWPMSLALGGTLVQVPAGFLEQSRQILSDYHAGILEDELNEVMDLQKEHCPRCGSMDFNRTMRKRHRMFTIFIALFFGPFPTRAC